MALFFLDSSAVIKLYVLEKGTSWISSLFQASANRFIVSRIAQVEVSSALARRLREKTITSQDKTLMIKQFEYHLASKFRVVAIDKAICRVAASLVDHQPLRAYDSVQLACALKANQTVQFMGLQFLSADLRLLQAAQAEGLFVDNPENY